MDMQGHVQLLPVTCVKPNSWGAGAHSVWKNLNVFLALLGTFLAEPPALLPLTGLPLLLTEPLLSGLPEGQ